jgi:HTH-type transcriptional regulator/antitoxin HigA
MEMSVDIRDAESYRDLLMTFEPRPIRSQEEAEAVMQVIDALTDLPVLSQDQRDFISLLAEML